MTQKYLKNTGLIVLITVLSMIPPLSMDLYMPALPDMTEYFDTTSTLTTFTMTVFFIFMAIGMLLLGPLSDKYGRKPLLLVSILIYLIFSIASAVSPSIWFLIVARAIQAFGAGGMVSIATTLIKDSFEGKLMSKVLSITQALGVLAPMLAPILGALILKYANWQMNFIVLALFACLMLIGTLLLQETLPKEKRTTESTFKSIMSLTEVVKDKNFSSLLLIGGLFFAPFMAYLGLASFIYIEAFGVSETTFSVYFAITSAFTVLGPILYMKFGNPSVKGIFRLGFTIAILSALALFFIGDSSPIVFLLCFVPFAVVNTYYRPMISDMLLSTQKSNVGAASSVMNFGFTVIGSIGMFVGTMKWNGYVNGLSYTMLIFIVLALLVWIYILKAKSIKFDWK